MENIVNRRRFLKLGALALGACLSPAALAKQSPGEKTLALYNPHTGEHLKAVYWAEGDYIPETLGRINHLMRDFRRDEVKPIDPALLDLLFALREKTGYRRPFHVISGYRSPATNAMLRRTSHGVAKHSFHMKGKAVDISLPGYKTGTLYKAALSLRGGGVGYYPRSGFIHMDTGRVRTWRG